MDYMNMSVGTRCVGEGEGGGFSHKKDLTPMFALEHSNTCAGIPELL